MLKLQKATLLTVYSTLAMASHAQAVQGDPGPLKTESSKNIISSMTQYCSNIKSYRDRLEEVLSDPLSAEKIYRGSNYVMELNEIFNKALNEIEVGRRRQRQGGLGYNLHSNLLLTSALLSCRAIMLESYNTINSFFDTVGLRSLKSGDSAKALDDLDERYNAINDDIELLSEATKNKLSNRSMEKSIIGTLAGGLDQAKKLTDEISKEAEEDTRLYLYSVFNNRLEKVMNLAHQFLSREDTQDRPQRENQDEQVRALGSDEVIDIVSFPQPYKLGFGNLSQVNNK